MIFELDERGHLGRFTLNSIQFILSDYLRYNHIMPGAVRYFSPA